MEAAPQDWERALARRLHERRLADVNVLRRALAEVERLRRRGQFTNLTTLLVTHRLVDPRALQATLEEMHRELSAARSGAALAPSSAGSSPPTPEGTSRARVRLPGDVPEPRAGEVVAGCTIERELGRGAMGIVFLARDRSGQQVAVKVLTGIERGASRRQRFRREVEIARALDHPSLVRVLAADPDGPVPSMTMEFVPGKTLKDLLEQQAGLDAKLSVLEQVCRAAGYAHDRGVIHRDLKPANILVTPEGAAKVTDFGVALDTERETRLTVTGASLGTPHYMSPEQIHGSTVTPQSDVWSLGVMLYECVCGRRPFDADTPVTLCAAIVGEEPPPPSRIAGVSEDFDLVIGMALGKTLSSRYDTAHTLAREISRLRSGAPVKARELARTATRGPSGLVLLVGGLVAAASLAAGVTALVLRADGRTADAPAQPSPGSPGPQPGTPTPPPARPDPTPPPSPSNEPPDATRIRECLSAGDVAGARRLTLGARGLSPALRTDLSQAISDEQSAQERVVERAVALERDLSTDQALAIVSAELAQRPKAARLHLEMAWLLSAAGRWREATFHDEQVVALDAAFEGEVAERERTRRRVRDTVAAITPAGPLPPEWIPFRGGPWGQRDGVLVGRGTGLAACDLTAVIRADAPWAKACTVEVEVQLRSGRPGPCGGILFGARSADEYLVYYVFSDPVSVQSAFSSKPGALEDYVKKHGSQPKFARLALHRDGQFAQLSTTVCAFADPGRGWARLSLRVVGRQVQLTVDGVRLPALALSRDSLDGRLGLAKYYDSEVEFRGWRVTAN